MKTKLKYFFARLVVLLVAIHTLNVSIDFDHIVYGTSYYSIEQHDDVDSFSELIVETIFNDSNLVKEGNHDDSNAAEKQFCKHHVVVYVSLKQEIKLTPVSKLTQTKPTQIINSRFQLEDYSQSNYTPPDHLAC